MLQRHWYSSAVAARFTVTPVSSLGKKGGSGPANKLRKYFRGPWMTASPACRAERQDYHPFSTPCVSGSHFLDRVGCVPLGRSRGCWWRSLESFVGRGWARFPVLITLLRTFASQKYKKICLCCSRNIRLNLSVTAHRWRCTTTGHNGGSTREPSWQHQTVIESETGGIILGDRCNELQNKELERQLRYIPYVVVVISKTEEFIK